MASAYDNAVAELYRAPFDKFVAERKRLASELKAGGDSAGAARLSNVTRPPISAWAVNQLFWQDRKTFDELFKTAERLRDAGYRRARGNHTWTHRFTELFAKTGLASR